MHVGIIKNNCDNETNFASPSPVTKLKSFADHISTDHWLGTSDLKGGLYSTGSSLRLH